MLEVIILGLIIILIISAFLFKKKTVADKTTTRNNTIKVLVITIFGIFVLTMFITPLMSNGLKFFYCLSDDKCITVWKRASGEVYIILGVYRGKKVPSDNYVKMKNIMFDYIDVIFKQEDKLIISFGEKVDIEQKSSNGLIEIYRDNKTFNDSLYTYLDSSYRKFKKNVDFISINIKENYAIDNAGNRIKSTVH